MGQPLSYTEYGSKKGYAIFHPAGPQWLVINSTGRDIFLALLAGSGIDEVAVSIAREYGVGLDRSRADVFRVQNSLSKLQFLDVASFKLQERRPEPRSLFLHLTHRCNLSCTHCYAGDRPSETPRDLPTRVVFSLFEQIKEAGGGAVTLSGGEPLLHPDIRSILAHARPELEIRLLTNGTLINQNWADILAGQKARVQVSLDGSCPEVHDAIRGKGSFEKTVRAVALLQEAGLGSQVNLATTVMRQNLADLPKIIDRAKQMGVPLVRFLPVRKRGTAVRNWEQIGKNLTRQDAEQFYDFVIHTNRDRSACTEVSCGLSGFMLAMPDETDDDIWCPVGRQLVVDVDGSAYPCAAMMTPEFRMGSVFTESVEDLFFGTPMKMVCQALTERRQEIERCAACTWRNLCQSGCMALALEHKGTIWDTDDFCEYRKKRYKEAFDRILAHEDEVSA